MLGRFIYGQCSLSEAFWKFSVLGMIIAAFITRVLMILLKQTVGYNTHYLKAVFDNISILSMNPWAFAWLCFYTASFLALIGYAGVCVVGMWHTYKEYEKSKVLAFICMAIVWGIIYYAVKSSIY